MIREMVKKDKKAVMDILRGTAMFTEAEVGVAGELIDLFLTNRNQTDYHIVVIENESHHVVGYLCWGPTPLTEGTHDLYWMAVAPDQQGSGFGKQLVKWLEHKVEERKGRMIVIETSSQPKYEPTRQFYLRAGYREVARIPEFYASGDDRVIYTKCFG